MRNFEGNLPAAHAAAAAAQQAAQQAAAVAAAGGGAGGGRRAYSSMSGRYPRSWHPSPFASDDDVASTDEPQFYKEEKKNRIKMEIARRRHQIEENACLHEELTRLAKLRENVEITDRLNVPMSSAMVAGGANSAGGVPVYGISPGISPAVVSAAVNNPHAIHMNSTAASRGIVDSTSVLKSVDEILRDGIGATPAVSHSHAVGGHMTDPYLHNSAAAGGLSRTNPTLSGSYMNHQAGGQHVANMMNHTGPGGHHDPYAAPHHQGVPTSGAMFDRVTDFSPINSDMSDLGILMGDMSLSGKRGMATAGNYRMGATAPQTAHHGMTHTQGYDATAANRFSSSSRVLPPYK